MTEAEKTYRKQYQKDNAHKFAEYRKQYMKKWKEKNPENQAQKQWYQNNKNKIKNDDLKKKFDITLDEYDIMLFQQDGKCKICGIHHTKCKKSLAVDHCHTTGKVRGLLCTHCNMLLGYAQDNINTLKSAIKYLKQ
jgi:hypothetical protein